jgi:hypothetical protein
MGTKLKDFTRVTKFPDRSSFMVIDLDAGKQFLAGVTELEKHMRDAEVLNAEAHLAGKPSGIVVLDYRHATSTMPSFLYYVQSNPDPVENGWLLYIATGRQTMAAVMADIMVNIAMAGFSDMDMVGSVYLGKSGWQKRVERCRKAIDDAAKAKGLTLEWPAFKRRS